MALPIFIKINDKEALGNCYLSITKIYIAQKNYPRALDNYQNAIRTVNLNFNSKNWIDNPIDTSLKYCQAKSDLAESFLAKAQTLKSLATKTKSTIYLDAAWQTYQTLNTLQALIRAEISTEKSKMNLGKQQDWVADALTIAKELQAKNPQKDYLSAAYAMVQQVKAQVINEHLQGERGKVLANISEAEQEKERLLLAEISQLRKQLLDDPNDATLPQKALDAEQKYYDYLENLAKQYPIFSKTKFDNKALSIKEIQDNLSDDMAVLDYLPTADSLHIFCINPYRLTWKTVAISKSDKTNIDSLQHTLNQAIRKIQTPESAAFLTRSYAAYRCLIAPIECELLGIKRLRIFPAAWVNRVGFESLCTSPYAGNWSDKKIPFMIRSYAISYLFSIKELQPKPRKKAEGSVSVGSFGISYSDGISFQPSRSPDSCMQFLNGTRGGGKLNFAVKEAKDVSALWGVGDCILENKATKKEFTKRCQSNNYSVLHLAMHGIPECDDPNNIQLVFSKDATNKDNLMRIYEIAGLRMHSDLAVLSACHSGAGQLENYEGVLSLGRAFKMAGCESLITSNSAVIDETSPDIFGSFYEKLKNENMPKDVALQKAICNYLDDKSDMERIPYRWANFHLWGNVDAIQGDSPNFFQRYWKYLLGIVFLFAIIYLYKVLKVRY
jgi:CHAT domain-containing protein